MNAERLKEVRRSVDRCATEIHRTLVELTRLAFDAPEEVEQSLTALMSHLDEAYNYALSASGRLQQAEE